MRTLFLTALSVCMLAIAAAAQTPAPSQQQVAEQNWDNLQMLRVGEKIQVVDQRLKKVDGEFVAVSEEAITFMARTRRKFLIFRVMNAETLRREDVLRISSWDRSSRKRSMLIGAAIGGVPSALVIAAAAKSQGKPDQLCCHPALAVPMLGFVALGAETGRLVSGPRTVYRAERRQGQTTP